MTPATQPTTAPRRRPPLTAGAEASIRVAAVGDLHTTTSHAAGWLRRDLLQAAAEADLLVLAGDLTHNGELEEAHRLAAEVRELGVPVAATTGNHDHHRGHADEVAAILSDAGVHMLEGTGIVLTIRGIRLGIAGVKGFGGGFPGALMHGFGEPEVKAFVAHARASAHALLVALAGLDCDVRVALTRYAPAVGTLKGEPRELYPLLGSRLLGQVIDQTNATLAIHGHAHHGREHGMTPAGWRSATSPGPSSKPRTASTPSTGTGTGGRWPNPPDPSTPQSEAYGCRCPECSTCRS